MSNPFLPPLFPPCFSCLVPVAVRGCVVVFIVGIMLPVLALGQARSSDSNAEPTRVGILGEFGLGVSQGSIPVYAGTPDCGLFESGTARGNGVMGMVRMPGLFGGKWGLSFALGWRSGTSALQASPVDPTVIFDSATSAPVALDRTLRLQRDDQRALFSSNVEYQLTPQLTVGLGAELTYRLSFTTTQTDNVNGPGDHSFDGGQRSRAMNQGERLSGAGISLALAPAADYTFPLGRRLSGMVGIAGHVDLLSVVERVAWRDLTMQARVGLMMSLGGSDTAEPISPAFPSPLASQIQKPDAASDTATDTVLVSALPPPASPRSATPFDSTFNSNGSARNRAVPQPLVAQLELSALDAAGKLTPVAVVHVDDVRRQRRWELRTAGAVVIDEGLLQQQLRLSSAAAAQFVPDSLGSALIPELQSQLLNIIGFRMATLHPNAGLTLRGPSRLSGEVRNYLHTAWGIAQERMEVRSTNESEGGANQQKDRKKQVALMTDTPPLFDPVWLSTQSATVDPPRIQLSPAFQSGAGIQEWSIRIVHNGQPVGEYSHQSASSGSAQINWQIAATGASGKMTTLLAELNVRDSSGASTRAAAQLPLQVMRVERITEQTLSFVGEVMQSRWLLPESVVASNQNSEALQERILGEVIAAVRSGSNIEVVTMHGEAMAWGSDVAAVLRAKCAAAGKRCSIFTKSAAVVSGAVEIKVVGR